MRSLFAAAWHLNVAGGATPLHSEYEQLTDAGEWPVWLPDGDVWIATLR